MDDANRDQLALLLEKSDDELLDTLAADLYGDGLGALPAASRRERAARWLDRFVDQRRDEICDHRAVAALLDHDTFDALEESAAIFDALAAAAGAPPPVTLTVVALLLARRGLRSFCASR